MSEVCGLKWCDAFARPQGGQITVFGKGGKTRTVLLKPKVWEQLLSIKGESKATDPIFSSRKGGRELTCPKSAGSSTPRPQSRPGAEGFAALDAPRSRQPRARPQRPDSPGAGHTRTCLGLHDRSLSARPPYRKFQLLSAGLGVQHKVGGQYFKPLIPQHLVDKNTQKLLS